MVMSPSDVSKSTDMIRRVLCRLVVFVAKVPDRKEERVALS
jgi:hypothetical protein